MSDRPDKGCDANGDANASDAQPKPKKWIRAKIAEPQVFVLRNRDQGHGFGNICYVPFERQYDRAKEGACWYDRIDAEQDARRSKELLGEPIPEEPPQEILDALLGISELPESFEPFHKRKGKK